MTGIVKPEEQSIPSAWIWASIGSITQEIEKVKPKDEPDQEFIYLDISSIDNEQNIVTSPKKYLGAEAPSRARQKIKTGDVLFSTVRTYLRNIARVPEQFNEQIASTGFSILRSKDGVDGRYLFYYTLTDKFIVCLSEIQRGTSYPAVRDSDVREQKIPIAPTNEQIRLVDEIEMQFTRLDVAVANLKRVQANLERYKASVLKAACEGRLAPQDPDDEPAAVLLERILAERRRKWEEQEWTKLIDKAKKKAAQAKRRAEKRPSRISDLEAAEWQELTEEDYGKYLPKGDKWKGKYKEPEPVDAAALPELPEGWVWATIEPISHFVTDGDHNPPKRVSDGIPHLTAKHVTNRILSLKDCTFITEKDFSRVRKRYDPRPGDVIITCVGTLGRTAIVPEEFIFSADRNLAIARMLERGVLPEFLQIFLNSPAAQRELRKGSGSTAQPHLYLKEIRKFPVTVAPRQEQSRIVNEVENRFTIIDVIEAQIKDEIVRAERLRQSILRQAFNGRLVPQDPKDEPAIALLSRIRDGNKGA